MGARKVTMSDIARESGASPTTVSLVLRDKPGIGAETRDRVLAAAQALGYERRPRGGSRSSRALLTTAILFRVRARTAEDRTVTLNPFYSWVLSGLESSARQQQMNLLYGTIAVDTGNRIIDTPDHLLEQDLDGVIIIGALTTSQVDGMLRGKDVPVVLVDGPSTPGRFDAVASDNVGGMRRLTEYLIGLGHRHIALLNRGTEDNPNFAEREQGYLSAMQHAGLEPRVERVEDDRVGEGVKAARAASPPATALMAVNDQFALDAVKACATLGVRVPDEMSVTGFDNIELGSVIEPGLTTMHVDKVGMGRHALNALMYRRRWPDAAPGCLILSPKLLARGSAAPPVADADSHSSHVLGTPAPHEGT